MSARTGLLLINLGTPDAPHTAEVRRYLAEFLDDPRVIDLAAWKRRLLLNAVILPFRPAKSAEAYRKIWSEARGSPLLFHGMDLRDRLREALGEGVQVELAMRYQKPSIPEALASFQDVGVDSIVAFPLFPHYASSSWGSAVQKLYEEAGALINPPHLHVVPFYYDHPAFIRAFAAVTRPVLEELGQDKLLMSFHGLPERHMRASDFSGAHCLAGDACCAEISAANRYCYRAQCYATARALAAELELGEDDYEVAFQSRLGRDPWIQPFTDVRLQELAKAGVKKLAVVVPSFVADCLETLEEIAMRGKEDFVAHGGQDLRLVPSLNSEAVWVDAVQEILGERCALGPR